jgi:hypothetical protein
MENTLEKNRASRLDFLNLANVLKSDYVLVNIIKSKANRKNGLVFYSTFWEDRNPHPLYNVGRC